MDHCRINPWETNRARVSSSWTLLTPLIGSLMDTVGNQLDRPTDQIRAIYLTDLLCYP